MENGHGVSGTGGPIEVNGSNTHEASGVEVNGHIEQPRAIRYRVTGSGFRTHYTTANRLRRCACREMYTYPNTLVYSVDDERRELVHTVTELRAEIEVLRATVSAREGRIQTLEAIVIAERARARASRAHARRSRIRITRIVDEVRERASGILAGTTRMSGEIGDMIDNMDVEESSEEEPEEEEPEEEEEEEPFEDPVEGAASGGSAAN